MKISIKIILLFSLIFSSCDWYIDNSIPYGTIEKKIDFLSVSKYYPKCIWIAESDSVCLFNLETNSYEKVIHFDVCSQFSINAMLEGKKYLYFLPNFYENEKGNDGWIKIVNKQNGQVINLSKNWQRFANIKAEYIYFNKMQYHELSRKIVSGNSFYFKTDSANFFKFNLDADTFIQVFANDTNKLMEPIFQDFTLQDYSITNSILYQGKVIIKESAEFIYFQNKLYCAYSNNNSILYFIDTSGNKRCAFKVNTLNRNDEDTDYGIVGNYCVGINCYSQKHDWNSLFLTDRSFTTMHHDFYFYDLKTNSSSLIKTAYRCNDYYTPH
ncbi:MAG: hypothetical protein RIQ33_733 [Bacteroidota bacterium]